MTPDWLRELNEALDEAVIPEFWPVRATVNDCHRILPAHEAAEIQQAAFLMHNGYHVEAEQHRIAAGYGGLGIRS